MNKLFWTIFFVWKLFGTFQTCCLDSRICFYNILLLFVSCKNIFIIFRRICNIQEKLFIIFRRICNIQEKLFIQYSVQWGQNFFFQCKTANSFYSKINDSSRVRTTAFSSSRFGVRVCVVPNIFTIYP